MSFSWFRHLEFVYILIKSFLSCLLSDTQTLWAANPYKPQNPHLGSRALKTKAQRSEQPLPSPAAPSSQGRQKAGCSHLSILLFCWEKEHQSNRTVKKQHWKGPRQLHPLVPRDKSPLRANPDSCVFVLSLKRQDDGEAKMALEKTNLKFHCLHS